MISKIIDLLIKENHYGISDRVEIAKGKYEYITTWKDSWNKIKDIGSMANKKFTIEIETLDNIPNSLANLRELKKQLKEIDKFPTCVLILYRHKNSLRQTLPPFLIMPKDR